MKPPQPTFPELRKEGRRPINGVATEHLSFGAMEFVTGRAFALGTFTLKDNFFDRVAASQHVTPTHDYNGYITNSTAQWLTNRGTHNVFTNAFSYETRGLGRCYQPTNSPFLSVGSTNANFFGLYHYTVVTNNVKETNSMVDIGFHYVATNANGSPLDEDSDGTPDYLEDLNGNGTVDSGETDSQSTGDNSLRVLITRPGNGSILP